MAETSPFRALARSNRDAGEIWQVAEWHCLAGGFAERLESLGLRPTAEAGAALMAAAVYLAERTEEWGGDARDVLADLVQLGDAVLELAEEQGA